VFEGNTQAALRLNRFEHRVVGDESLELNEGLRYDECRQSGPIAHGVAPIRVRPRELSERFRSVKSPVVHALHGPRPANQSTDTATAPSTVQRAIWPSRSFVRSSACRLPQIIAAIPAHNGRG